MEPKSFSILTESFVAESRCGLNRLLIIISYDPDFLAEKIIQDSKQMVTLGTEGPLSSHLLDIEEKTGAYDI
jgi:hypothetical protein